MVMWGVVERCVVMGRLVVNDLGVVVVMHFVVRRVMANRIGDGNCTWRFLLNQLWQFGSILFEKLKCAILLVKLCLC